MKALEPPLVVLLSAFVLGVVIGMTLPFAFAIKPTGAVLPNALTLNLINAFPPTDWSAPMSQDEVLENIRNAIEQHVGDEAALLEALLEESNTWAMRLEQLNDE